MTQPYLDQLVSHTRIRIKTAQTRFPLEALKEVALALPKGEHLFKKSLDRPGLSFICEIKKASPSKGLISPNFPYLDLAKVYEDSQADALSCLTEPAFFLGSDEIFQAIRQKVSLPMLRKDFTLDPYQIYEAKCLGADALLLIVGLMEPDLLAKSLTLCKDLGLDALVEARTPEDIRTALEAGAEIIGVNNRRLADFSVDVKHAQLLREWVPPGILYVAESGLSCEKDIRDCRSAGVDGVLIGEALMKAQHPSRFLKSLKEAAL